MSKRTKSVTEAENMVLRQHIARLEEQLTENGRAKTALEESEDRFRYVFDHSVVGKSLTLPSGDVNVNQAFANMLGYTLEELKSCRWQDITHPDDIELTQNQINPLLAGERESSRFVKRYIHKSGAVVWADVSTTLRHDDQGKPLYFITSVLDISEQKRASDLIRLQLERMRALNQIDRAILSSLDTNLLLDTLLQMVRSQLGVDAVSILLLNKSTGVLEYFAGIGFLTDAIRKSRVGSDEGAAGQIEATRQVVHFSKLADLGKHFGRAEFLKAEKFVEYYSIPLVARNAFKGVLEIFNRTPLASDLDWLSYLETLGGQVAIAIDNSFLYASLQQTNAELEQRVIERTAELNQVNLELIHASYAKDEFLANMSHELRSPLTSILGITECLLEQVAGPLNARQENYVHTIETSGRHLLSLINDILDLSKIEAGKLVPRFEVVLVGEVCQASLAFVKEQAVKKNIKLGFDCEPATFRMVADALRLKQILVNLLSNAVKFTPAEGRVRLIVRGDEEKEIIHFMIEDTGIGIASHDLARLFTPFLQLDASLAGKFEGTGLGLVLVKRLAEMHGGTVTVESEVGKGSRFTVSIPWIHVIETREPTVLLKISEMSPLPAQLPTEAVHNQRILLTEDNEANAQVAFDYLSNSGYEVFLAHDGGEVLPLMETIRPDLVLMDIQMPVMDGLEVIRRLRSQSDFKNTPIIALTALAMTNDRERCLAAGANEYISKPFSLKTLVKMMDDLLRLQSQ